MDEKPPPIVERVAARAALAGNPSDSYGGAVFAVPVPAYAATVTASPAAQWSLHDDLDGPTAFPSDSTFREAVRSATSTSPHSLVLASIAEFRSTNGVTPRPCTLEVTTTIPLSVGLAGSSAIVIATLRALAALNDVPLSDPLELARAAHRVETERLGIAAGLQDRIVQALRAPVAMRFGARDSDGHGVGDDDADATFESLRAGGRFGLLVAHRPDDSEPSQVVHGDLRRRHEGGDPAVRTAMIELRQLGIDAAAAFSGGDVAALGRAMNATFDVRSNIIDLKPAHVKMVEVARSAGAAANYTGSGGAIVALCRTPDHAGSIESALTDIGCYVTHLAARS